MRNRTRIRTPETPKQALFPSDSPITARLTLRTSGADNI